VDLKGFLSVEENGKLDALVVISSQVRVARSIRR
jgi:hypothetical protein